MLVGADGRCCLCRSSDRRRDNCFAENLRIVHSSRGRNLHSCFGIFAVGRDSMEFVPVPRHRGEPVLLSRNDFAAEIFLLAAAWYGFFAMSGRYRGLSRERIRWSCYFARWLRGYHLVRFVAARRDFQVQSRYRHGTNFDWHYHNIRVSCVGVSFVHPHSYTTYIGNDWLQSQCCYNCPHFVGQVNQA